MVTREINPHFIAQRRTNAGTESDSSDDGSGVDADDCSGLSSLWRPDCVLEGTGAFFFIGPHVEFTLAEALAFSPRYSSLGEVLTVKVGAFDNDQDDLFVGFQVRTT